MRPGLERASGRVVVQGRLRLRLPCLLLPCLRLPCLLLPCLLTGLWLAPGRAGAQPAEAPPSAAVIVVEGGAQVVHPPAEEDAAPPFFADPAQAGARTIIPRSAFQGTQKSVADVLEEVPGVAVTRSGDSLGGTRVSIRGSRPEQVLVLVDGVPVSAPADSPAQRRAEGRGGLDLAALPLERVESIEIVRGAATSLYGPGAAAGAVLIRLRRARQPTLEVAGTVGSDGYQEVDGAWTRLLGAADAPETGAAPTLTLHLNRRHSPGRYVFYDPEAAQATTTIPGGNPCAAPLGDGLFERRCNAATTTTLEADWRAGARRHLGLTLELLERDGLGGTENPRPFGREERRRARLVYDDGQVADPRAPEAALWRWHGFGEHLGSVRQENTQLDAAGSSAFTDRRAGGEVRREQWLQRHRLEVGGALERQVLDDTAFTAERSSAAVFGGWDYHATDGTLEASLRRDDLSGLEPAGTARAALAWRVAGPVGAKASRGDGYRPPSLYELYAPGSDGGYSVANPALQPERSVSRDGGLYAVWGETAYLEALAFQQDTAQQIVAVPVGSLFRFENVERTRTTGVETAANLRLGGGYSADANWTRQDARIVAQFGGQDEGHVVPGVPDMRAGLSLAWRQEGRQAWLQARHSGRRYVTTANVRYLQPYTTLAAGLTWPLGGPGSGWSVTLEGRNLTATTYVELDNEPPPGRQFILTLRWRQGGAPDGRGAQKKAEAPGGLPPREAVELPTPPIPGRGGSTP